LGSFLGKNRWLVQSATLYLTPPSRRWHIENHRYQMSLDSKGRQMRPIWKLSLTVLLSSPLLVSAAPGQQWGYFYQMSVHPANPDRILVVAVTWRPDWPLDPLDSPTSLYSSDGGRTFEEIGQDFNFRNLHFDATGSTIFGLDQIEFIQAGSGTTRYDSAVRTSTDRNNWSSETYIPGSMTTEMVTQLHLHPTQPWYYGTSTFSRIYRSIESFTNWHVWQDYFDAWIRGGPRGNWLQVLISPTDPNTGYLVSDDEGIFTNSGTNITPNGLDGTIPAGKDGFWDANGAIDPVTGEIYFSHLVTEEPPYRSDDGGVTWTRLDTYPGERPVELHVTSDSYLLVLEGDGSVHGSPDKGVTWSHLTEGISGGGVGQPNRRLVSSFEHPKRVYLLNHNQRVGSLPFITTYDRLTWGSPAAFHSGTIDATISATADSVGTVVVNVDDPEGQTAVRSVTVHDLVPGSGATVAVYSDTSALRGQIASLPRFEHGPPVIVEVTGEFSSARLRLRLSELHPQYRLLVYSESSGRWSEEVEALYDTELGFAATNGPVGRLGFWAVGELPIDDSPPDPPPVVTDPPDSTITGGPDTAPDDSEPPDDDPMVSTPVAPLTSGAMMHDYRRTWPVPVDGNVETPGGSTHQVVFVPQGFFQMGGESHHDDGLPFHEVYLSSYYIDQYEVSHGQYLDYATVTGRVPLLDASDIEDPLLPANGVTWQQANDYCEWAGMRLPTEAEWEKAARGTDTLIYPWGDTIDRSMANWGPDNDGDQPTLDDRDGYETMNPVNAFPEGASPYGALNMSGNVWEWVLDWHQHDYYSASPRRDPAGPEEGAGGSRVLRGGSFQSIRDRLQNSDRGGGNPDAENWDQGFRCVLPAPGSETVWPIPTDSETPMVYVPPGAFEMGLEESEWRSQDAPIHTVDLDGYYIDRHEVTVAQWIRFAQVSGRRVEDDPDRLPNHPITHVSWFDAADYCGWVGLTLPTEAEWEKAARGTDQRTYPWGDELDSRRANHGGSNDPWEDRPTPVEMYDGSSLEGYETLDGRSPYGAHDMAGNVWEWVQDWYSEDYYLQSPERNPLNDTEATFRVRRGSSHAFDDAWLPSGARHSCLPSGEIEDNEHGCYDVGFRCALTPRASLVTVVPETGDAPSSTNTPVQIDLNGSDDNQSLTELEAATGDRITLQIHAVGFPESIGFGFNLQYDIEMLTYVEESFEIGTFLGGASAVARDDGGLIDAGGARLGGSPSSGDGHLANVSFEVKDTFVDSTKLILTQIGYTLADGSFQEENVRIVATIHATGDLLGDFDDDGSVGFSDFLLFAAAFGGNDLRFDISGDGAIGFADFLIFAGQFGK
jgi:formylglycine-generating enzyme required for sulfatase activity